jgi:hypothetical protein
MQRKYANTHHFQKYSVGGNYPLDFKIIWSSVSKTFESARWKSCTPFLQIIVMKKGSENDQT